MGQRPDKNEIITERHSNGLKKLVLIFEGEGLNEILIGKYGFYENGLKRFVELYNNNLKNGKSIYWYENGQKKEEGTLKDGKHHGLITGWYENGQKKEEITYKNGKRNGKWTLWYENGQKKLEGTYKDDELISSKCWDEDGNECSICMYYGCK